MPAVEEAEPAVGHARVLPAAVDDRPDRAGHGHRRAVHVVGLGADRERHLGADPGRHAGRDRLRVVQRLEQRVDPAALRLGAG